MTGIGAYFYIVWGIWLRHCLNGQQDAYYLRWPRVWSLPDVVRRNNDGGGDGVGDAADKTNSHRKMQ